jgi:type IV secretory pathway VirB3-like protein
MREVVKEVLKLLKAGVIYLVSDSEWVSPVQVVLKKGGMIVIRNEKNELILQWMVTLVIIRSRSIWMTRARPPSHVHMSLLHTGKCHLDYVMLQHHFKGA